MHVSQSDESLERAFLVERMSLDESTIQVADERISVGGFFFRLGSMRE